MFAQAYAQAAGSAAAPSPLVQFAPLVLIFIVFYFFMLRPQKKKLQEEQDMLKDLKKGDEVYTKSGLLGKVHGLTDKIITMEVSEGMRVKILRSQVGGLASKIFEKKEPTKA
ncbi:MAG: preprotein translocase subunit YajC [Bacteriovoracaceae bacterium]|jgi:preprotein translocase subunit YajC|nr:preprotein translocase subunit YajC [Bacteriovoracaceae bacterium]